MACRLAIQVPMLLFGACLIISPLPITAKATLLQSDSADFDMSQIGTFANTYAVALGDVDGDGDLDLVLGNASSFSGTPQPSQLYLNNGTADPWIGVVPVPIGDGQATTYAVALGDVDGDGDLDLVLGNASSFSGTPQPSQLYLNNGTAHPWSNVTSIPIGDGRNTTQAVVLGDVDSDGDLDLVLGNYNQPSQLYLNNGTAHAWSDITGLPIGDGEDDPLIAEDSLAVALGDVDGDGDLDLVLGNPSKLYLNNGTAHPWSGVTGVSISGTDEGDSAAALGDVDSDGDLDLVLGNDERGRLYVNNGTAAPWNGVVPLPIGDGSAYDVVLGDVDGDGGLDLLVGNPTQPSQLYLNNGTTQPWSGVAPLFIGRGIGNIINTPLEVALGDVDGDSDLDLVVCDPGLPSYLYLNNGMVAAWSEAGPPPVGDLAFYFAMALGDVDGDGDLDLVVGNSYYPGQLYLNNGTSTPWSGVEPLTIGDSSTSGDDAELGDVDRDGDLDLVLGNRWLYLNNGTAQPWSGVTGVPLLEAGEDTTATALGDVDGDGDLDLVISNVDQPGKLYLNNGTTQPWSEVVPLAIGDGTATTLDALLGDVDGDGDLDLVFANAGQPSQLYLNNGTAQSWSGVVPLPIGDGAAYTTDAALGI